MKIDGMESTERIGGVAVITDAKPGERPVRDPECKYCRYHHLWARAFSSGFFFCVNCEARVEHNFLSDVLDGTELVRSRYREPGDGPEFIVILDEVFEERLKRESLADFEEGMREPSPAFFHSFVLGAKPRWDECKLDGREIAASRAEVILDPCEIPTVKLSVHANFLKEYLDKAKLDLAVIRRDGTEIVIKEAAFIPRDEKPGWLSDTIRALEDGDLDRAANHLRDERLRRERVEVETKLSVTHKFDAGELEAGIKEAIRALDRSSLEAGLTGKFSDFVKKEGKRGG